MVGSLRPNFTKGSRSGFAIMIRDAKRRGHRQFHKLSPPLKQQADHYFVVSGQTTMTNMPVKSTRKDSEIKSSSREISGRSEQAQYPTMTSSQLASLVSLFPLLENVEVFRTSQGELFSSRSAESYEIKDRATYSLRMLKDYFLMTQAEHSRLYSFRWMNLGMMRNGLSQTLNITYRRIVKGSLSSVLEEKADEKYYLSEKVLKKIFEKKDAHPDIRWKSGIKGEGKVAFPDDPDKPSRAITTGESGANRMTHGILLDRGKIRETKISSSLDANYYKGIDNHAERTNVLYWKNSKEKWVNEERINIPALKQQLDLCRRPLIDNKIAVRRLTPIECERLQGFPDDWTKGVSDTQRYKQMGNAVSVPVIKAMGRKILECVA